MGVEPDERTMRRALDGLLNTIRRRGSDERADDMNVPPNSIYHGYCTNVFRFIARASGVRPLPGESPFMHTKIMDEDAVARSLGVEEGNSSTSEEEDGP